MSVLIKIGDAWVDPLRVESVAKLYEDTEEVHHSYRPPTVRTFYALTNSPTASTVGCRIECYERYVDALGVDADEAAAAINRCREQSMGKVSR